jgi:hypothetical protein
LNPDRLLQCCLRQAGAGVHHFDSQDAPFIIEVQVDHAVDLHWIAAVGLFHHTWLNGIVQIDIGSVSLGVILNLQGSPAL